MARTSSVAARSGSRDGNERHAERVRVHSASPRGAASSVADGTTRWAGPATEKTMGRLAWLLATRDAHGLYRKVGFEEPNYKVMERRPTRNESESG